MNRFKNSYMILLNGAQVNSLLQWPPKQCIRGRLIQTRANVNQILPTLPISKHKCWRNIKIWCYFTTSQRIKHKHLVCIPLTTLPIFKHKCWKNLKIWWYFPTLQRIKTDKTEKNITSTWYAYPWSPQTQKNTAWSLPNPQDQQHKNHCKS